MDGFRDRMSGRYDRNQDRGDRYERPRRSSEELSIDQIADAVDKSNRSQMEVIADFFDDAKADRLESERAIIDALSNRPMPSPRREGADSAQGEEIAAIINDNKALIGRIEKIATQNGEAIDANGAMIEKILASLRENTGLLNQVFRGVQDSGRGTKPQTVSMNDPEAIKEVMRLVSENRAILGQMAEGANVKTDETLPADPAGASTSETVQKQLSDLTEHVHMENVKCYRNVQAAMGEQNAELVKSVDKKMSGMKGLLIAALALSALNLAGIAALIGAAAYMGLI